MKGKYGKTTRYQRCPSRLNICRCRAATENKKLLSRRCRAVTVIKKVNRAAAATVTLKISGFLSL
jgi:hypothetical protein